MTIWRMRIACWIPKATNTQWEYVIFFAFPLQQWLHERASMFRYTCLARPVHIYHDFSSKPLTMFYGTPSGKHRSLDFYFLFHPENVKRIHLNPSTKLQKITSQKTTIAFPLHCTLSMLLFTVNRATGGSIKHRRHNACLQPDSSRQPRCSLWMPAQTVTTSSTD